MTMASSSKHPFDSSNDSSNSSGGASKPSKSKSTNTIAQEEQELKIKPFCECEHCTLWTNNADWCPTAYLEFEGYNKKILKKKKNTQPLLKSEKYPSDKDYKIVSFKLTNTTKIEKQKLANVLVHGVAIPEPVDKCNETYFSKNIQFNLEKMNYKYSLPVQSFVWPAIFKWFNVVVVGQKKCGKTLAYLPAICTFVTENLKSYEDLDKYKGPLVVIVCSNSKKCEEVYDLLKKVCANIKIKVCNLTYPVTKLQSTDVVITLPETLVHCLKERIFNFKRLCHLVIEDCNTILQNHQLLIYKVLEIANEVLEHRNNDIKIQLIAVAEKWTSAMKELLENIHSPPLVCINSYLEAALYGGINFVLKAAMSYEKQRYLEEILKNKYHIYKTVVICNDEEIVELNRHLVRNGIQVITISNSSSAEEISQYESNWIFTQGGRHKVLLCTDFVFDSLLRISDAIWLVHYSFPATWTRFIKRFSALSSYYKSPLNHENDDMEPSSYLIIDETCEDKMNRIIYLLKRLNLDLPAKLQQYVDMMKKRIEEEKLKQRVAFCENVKLFGTCANSFCEYRHKLNSNVDVHQDLPQWGKITFKILHIKDVTKYTVQLLQHKDLNEKLKTINEDDLKKPVEYEADEMPLKPDEIVIGKFYTHYENTTEGESFHICHVIKIERDTVDVMLTTGLPLQTSKHRLFEVPRRIKIVDIYLCNFVPPFKDENFSGRSFYLTRTSLEQVNYKSMALTGTVLLQVDRTYWVDNVCQLFTVDGIDVVKFNLNKHLMKLNVVQNGNTQIKLLHKLCKECGIALPSYAKTAAKSSATAVVEVEPQWAFLDENIHEVILSSAVNPGEFYVRLVKFQSLLEILENDIQKALKTEIPNKPINVEIGKFYLAPDPKEQNYSRARILNVENDKALCYYVDYGDEAIVDVSKIRMLPIKYLTKLPFQAIQCRLYGLSPLFGDWDDESTDILYKYMFEPDSDIFRSLFVEMRSKDSGDSIRAKVKYSILLKDGFGSNNVLINQIILDCGLATSIFNKLDDFEIPKPEITAEDSDDDDLIRGEGVETVGETSETDSNQDSGVWNNFDFEVIDPSELLAAFGFGSVLPSANQSNNQLPALNAEFQQSEEAAIARNSPEGKALQESGYLTPEVIWSQTEKEVKIKIQLIGVHQYKVNIVKNSIFTFSTSLDGKEYALKFVLHKAATLRKHSAYGQEVRVTLEKLKPLDWMQLTNKKKLRYIHYEVANIEEKRRKFLQLDITDDEESSADEPDDDLAYFDYSSENSEFDHEIPESDSDY